MASKTPYFGVSFEWSVSVEDGLSSLSGLELIKARISSVYPSTATIEDSSDEAFSGFVQAKSTWASGDAPNEKIITFDAISDPDPTDIGNETYYLILNKRLESGGDDVPELIPFTIRRANSLQSRISITTDDVTERESKIGELKGTAWVQSHIDRALPDFIRRLKNRQWERRKVMESDYNQAFTYFVLQRCCYDLSSETGDRWEKSGDRWKEAYEVAFSGDDVRVDTNDDQHMEPNERSDYSLVFTAT